MADAGQQRPLTAFAPPPPLWKHFTPDNLKKLDQIKKNASKNEDGKLQKKKWTPAELQALDVPPELRFLIPPEIPKSGHYSVFGELQSLSTALPSLQDQGITQLYPSPPTGDADREQSSEPTRPLNHAYYLLKISKSLLLNFLEFVGILSVAPEQFESKVEDLRNLFINAHHLLNLYRPHQARESLILMMEEQLSRTREEIQQMDKLKEEITGALDQLKKDGIDVDAASVESPDNDTKKPSVSEERVTGDSRLVWDLLDENN
ncbi:mediator of RNA polymerase II transcription subunit 7 [Aspergillus nomiae NRRL 13137]|uniref:Mediator of RNA polymerase II transcription subunit 7 n=1 Tax=Aspergillus nomiae NRRL (strain ATCC 15546 / NRRL 13137 / CBS 260.88 / M93) TaxID=1509407 RepID=A0A0L1JFJ4_ASPN3|nr:mediator of RNA polymerase II transcription subunit 7 [Aspergillus nomiae NRRL 13137]KNG90550.1 mediator of RNA polymerase II transcription subunit 7 [Aspergillus nomiae NRRL 13137]